MENELVYRKSLLLADIIELILQLERADAYEAVKMVRKECREYVQKAVKKAPARVEETGAYFCKDWEERVIKYNTQLTLYQWLQLKIRKLNGWDDVNDMITYAPRHENEIMISRCCPSCQKIESNIKCNKCSVNAYLEHCLSICGYDPEKVYFVKRVCKACKTWKIQNETSAAA